MHEVTPQINYRAVAIRALVIFLLVFALVISLIGTIFFLETGQWRSELEADERHTTELLKMSIVEHIESVNSDLMFVAGLNQVEELFHQDGSVDPRVRGALNNKFLLLAYTRKMYDQIRVLDKTGMEIMRVNFNSGSPTVVADSELQNKADRYYFDAIFSLSRGEVYVSPFDLNVEHGKIEQPRKPVIRFGTPIFDGRGRKVGIVVLNYLGTHLLDKFIDIGSGAEHRTILLNSKGYYLSAPNPVDEWAFMYMDRKDITFGKAYPTAWQRIKSEQSGQFEAAEGLFIFTTVYPHLERQRSTSGSGEAFDPSAARFGAKRYMWKIVLHTPANVLYAGRNVFLRWILALLAVLAVILGVGSWRLAWVRALRQQAKEALQKAKRELEIKVEERTSELRIANEQLRKKINEHKQAEERIAHLNTVLGSIRNVNELIVREKDRDRLLKRACENLIATHAYYTAWIVLIDKSGRFLTAAQAGLDGDFQLFVERLKGGQLSHCMVIALEQAEVLTFESHPTTCSDCPHVAVHAGKGIMTRRLESDEIIYGVMSVSFEPGYAGDEELRSLFGEVADDIGFALHTIELGREHKRSEEELKKRTYDLGERVKELTCLYSISNLSNKPDISLDDIFQEVVDLIPPGWQYPEITCARAIFEDQVYKTSNFDETVWKLDSDITVQSKLVGKLEVYYLEEKPEIDEGPYLKEERNLINAISERLGETIDRKRAEEELWKAHDKLEKRVIERTQELAVANKELESFSYSVSHDLQAPLRGMAGFSQILLEEYADKLDEQGKDYIKRLDAARKRMSQLIEDLLNLSRMMRREMQRQTVDLSQLARSVAAELQERQPHRRVTFRIAKGVTVDGDERLLRVVLENLLGNAWKFTAKCHPASIELGVLELEGEWSYFVRDNGVGFDMAYADKLFTPFQRLHGVTEFEGTGIGLATVGRIINRHGGRVWAEGEVEAGATFYFTL